ncbi:MAG: TolC family protein [Proteobacteria bacterium]|nr:TolC family protein [Pseudomonadota bacterium]MBU1715353.1 TolC family protein [Pseudomonadota bacterium]
MKLFNLVIAFFLFTGAAQAATLTELQQEALNNRKIIEKYQANLEIGKKNVNLAKSRYYPSVDFSYTVNALDESSAIENKENSVAYGAITWNLFSGFQDKYNVKSAKLSRKAEEIRLQGIKQDIQLNVALRYLSIYTRKASLNVAEDSYATLLKIYNDAENRFNVGLIKKNELLRFKVDLDNAVITQKKAQAELDKSVQLLRREIDTDIEPEQLLFSEFDQLPGIRDYNQYETEMLKNRSELQTLQELTQAAQAQTKAAYGSIYPRVDLSSSYLKYNDDFGPAGDIYDEEIRTKLTLSINLFDGFSKYNRVDKAKLIVDTLQYDLIELECDLKTQLKNLFLDYGVSSENVEVAQSSIEQAEENLRITRMSYQEGIEKESDLLDAITSLSRAQYNYVAAKSEVFANYFKITRAIEGF